MSLLRRHSTALGLIALLALWELAGLNGWVEGGVLPAPSAVLAQVIAEWGDYGPHIAATAQAAALGLLAGSVAAFLMSALILRFPVLEGLTAGLNIAIFSVPPIAVVPVLLILLDAGTERIVLAALTVYYPTLIATLLALRGTDVRLLDVVHAYGGSALTTLRLVRLRAGLPTILAGLRVAAPNAVLGAILGEFGSGARWGLGSFLLGSIGQGDPVRLWGIGLSATALAGAAYAMAWLLGWLFTRSTLPVALSPGMHRSVVGRPVWLLMMRGCLVLLVPLALWWGALAATGLDPIIAKTPYGVWQYLFLLDGSASSRAALGAALATTLPHAFAGLIAGILFAYTLAVLGQLAPWAVRGFMPVALVSQTMPLVALIPLLVLLLGRGVATTITITISVTFFPAFVTIAQGLAEVPPAAFDVVNGYGARAVQRLFYVAMPAALPHTMAAARLAAPRAMLGVMTAEWLATGDGLGGLLNSSRGMLDYGMIWSIAFVAVAIASGFYAFVGLIETRFNHSRR